MTKEQRIQKLTEINDSNLSPQDKVLAIKKFIKEEEDAEKEAKVKEASKEQMDATKKIELTNLDSTNEILQKLVDKEQGDISISLKIV